MEYLVTPFVTAYAEGGVLHYVYEAAAGVTDITAGFADKEKWGIDAGASEMLVYQIDLNPLLTWEDGEPVNADTYIYSMKAMLENAAGNYKTAVYPYAAEALRGARGYAGNASEGSAVYVYAAEAAVNGAEVYYINTEKPAYFFYDRSMRDYYDNGYAAFFTGADGTDYYQRYNETGGYVEVTDSIKDELAEIARNFGDGNPEHWIEFCYLQDGVYGHTPWEEVGLIKTGEYQLVYIAEYPIEYKDLMPLLKHNWAVREEYYEQGGYNAGLNTMSFGPFKLSGADDSGMTLVKNERWYGWDGGDRAGFYTYEAFTDYDEIQIKFLTGAGLSQIAAVLTGGAAPFPFEFNAADLFGNNITQADLGEKEVYFIYIWSAYSSQCLAEMGDLAAVAESLGGRAGFLGLLLDFNKDLERAAKLVDFVNAPFPHIPVETHGLEPILHMIDSNSVPASIIIDGNGNALGGQITGARGMGYAPYIVSALAERAGNCY
jgi:ABC-type transport system substrate-binding protein